ncbi:MAG TPA: hypothetical protein IGS52_05680 [Oscillatoriaceae cyanobacterium M33_DOE_052]|uniref:DUF1400 domain-containing protein n=1 Tax=Planktothricoides sp. SpSt-374 TaxID=2282167 RepID=A0A7C3VEZ9_9CYAN|nr:hypothetical protein [Oscillatoriaceae cyanobacterium M33_DOE_052]
MLQKMPFVPVCLLSVALLAQTPAAAQLEAFQTSEPGQSPRINLLAQTTNFSDLVLTLQDLPNSFEAMPPTDLEQLRQDLTQEDFKVASVFAFMDANNFELVMGITTQIQSAAEQQDFDRTLNQPEVLQALLTEGLGQTEIKRQQPLTNLNNIGNSVGGVSLDVDLEGVPARLDIIAFRRDVVGAFVFVMYLNEETPVIPAPEVARKLDARVIKMLNTGAN